MILLSSVILYQNKKKMEIWYISESKIFEHNKIKSKKQGVRSAKVKYPFFS